MSTFGDYKAYKKYEPAYKDWKMSRDLLDAKRQAYLKEHPEIADKEDIQRARALIRAIDVMDEYSQKRSENMEVATETIVGYGINFAVFLGAVLGGLIGRTKPVKKQLIKLVKPIEKFIQNKKSDKEITSEDTSALATQIASWVIGGFAGTIAAFPLMAWAAKTEVSASRKGRFDAMDKDLDNPNCFAVLTNEQKKQVREDIKHINLPDDKDIFSGLKESWQTLKDLAPDSSKYRKQRLKFLKELEDRKLHINDEMPPEEIHAAKRDQQLLTKIVEKIDIASQDYAENTELAVQTAIIGAAGLGLLLSKGVKKFLESRRKNANKIATAINLAGICTSLIIAIASAQLQKHASRIGRYKVKQDMLKHPEQLLYVDDEKANSIENVKVKNNKKDNIFKFLIKALKDNKEYEKYLKTTGMQEKKIFKAMEKVELDPEQKKNAVMLQKNTFRTFNKIDENSQKYSESVEALGNAITFPLNLITVGIASVLAPIIAFGGKTPKTKLEIVDGSAKVFGIMLLSSIPTIILNAYITKEQKKASRIADMMAIKELSDYREFRA